MPSENRTGDIQLHKARKYMLEKQLDEMKNRITGRNNSFYPYIADRTGKVSERKLARFIKDLLDGAQKYGRQHTLLEIKGELRELCECFLYCAIQGIGIYNEGEKYAERPACFFSDLTDIAKHKNNLFLTDENTLHSYEFTSAEYDLQSGECRYYGEFNEGGFFRSCDMAYLLLTGRHIVSTFPEEEFKQRCAERESEIAAEHGFDSYKAYLETMENTQKELAETSMSDFPDDMEFVCIDEDDALAEKQKHKNSEWRSTVISPEVYTEKYLRFRELFFKQTMFVRYHLFEEIVLMTDIFLYEHKLSSFSEEDVFAMIYYRTDKLCSSLERSSVGDMA